MGTVYEVTATITGTAIRAELRDLYAGTAEVAFTEPRPATLAEADVALAAHGLGRVRDWDLGADGTVVARVQFVDNMFNGVRAARLEQAVGTTHGQVETAPAGSVQDGDLIGALDDGPLYVVAGSRPGPETMRVHMVGEGRTWGDRRTTDFPAGQLVRIARRRA